MFYNRDSLLPISHTLQRNIIKNVAIHLDVNSVIFKVHFLLLTPQSKRSWSIRFYPQQSPSLVFAQYSRDNPIVIWDLP